MQLSDLVTPDEENPRVTWAHWLGSACHEVPSEMFRQFQRDTFEICMRYLPSRPVPGAVQIPPPQNPNMANQGGYMNLLQGGTGITPPGHWNPLPHQQHQHQQQQQQQQQLPPSLPNLDAYNVSIHYFEILNNCHIFHHFTTFTYNMKETNICLPI